VEEGGEERLYFGSTKRKAPGGGGGGVKQGTLRGDGTGECALVSPPLFGAEARAFCALAFQHTNELCTHSPGTC